MGREVLGSMRRVGWLMIFVGCSWPYIPMADVCVDHTLSTPTVGVLVLFSIRKGSACQSETFVDNGMAEAQWRWSIAVPDLQRFHIDTILVRFLNKVHDSEARLVRNRTMSQTRISQDSVKVLT